MAGGMPQEQGVTHVQEIIPAVKALWAGDYEHRGEIWQFPKATSVPKPLQRPHPPIWVAARDPGTFDWAIRNGANIQSTPLTRPMSEVQILAERFKETLRANPGIPRPRFLMLRRTCVYEDPRDWTVPVQASIDYGRHFENLFKNVGTVENGFPTPIELSAVGNRIEYDKASIRENMLFGTPDEVVRKLKVYQQCGVENFCYGSSFGLPFEVSRRSLQLFIDEVMPHFADGPGDAVGRPNTSDTEAQRAPIEA
jgi:alkanesulfonate monooxygenase SsuD/methylene tetrahydromethanopterin reductase-like flavin-dependent oxidoreductase (luciferase family)